MIEFVKQWVINIVALVLFIVMFEILLPTGKMKKYVNLVTGTILIIAIISPLTGLFGKNADITALQTSNSNLLDKLEIEKESKVLKEEQMKQIVEVYRDKIIGQLEQNAQEIEGIKQARADVIFNEDYNSETFGEIKRAYIEVVTEDAGQGATAGKGSVGESSAAGRENSVDTGTKGADKGENPIEPVSKIGKVSISDKAAPEAISEECDPVMKKRLEDRISEVFGINRDNIVISQIER